MRKLFEIRFFYDVVVATDNIESSSPEPYSCSFIWMTGQKASQPIS